MADAPKYRRQMVDPVRTGRRPGELGSSGAPSAGRNRDHQADRDKGRCEGGLATVEREELHGHSVAA